MIIRKFLSIGACATVAVAFTSSASAQLYAYEPFDYTAGADLVGASGGVGWTSAWGPQDGNSANAMPGAFTAVAGSLAGPAGLTTLGGSALMTGEFGTLQLQRSFPNIVGAADTTTWYSYIGQRLGAVQDPPQYGDNLYPRGVNIGLFDSENATRTERLSLGNSSNADTDEWSLIPEGSGSLRVGSGVPYSDLHWAVVRIDHHGPGTPDDAYLWLDPDPSSEPSTGTALVTIIGADGTNPAQYDWSGLDFLRPFIGNESSGRPFGVLAVDEIRIGGDYASMSAIPEPSTFALLGVAGLGLLVRRRRR